MFNLKEIYPKRDAWAHKGHFGRLLVVGGSNVYSGSPFFNAMSALRAGVDLVYIFAPERVANIVATKQPDILTIPYRGKLLTREQVYYLTQVINELKISAMVIGGGLGRQRETFLAVRKIIGLVSIPMCIDADAIRALENHWQVLQNKKVVLTPHTDEFRQLTGESLTLEIISRKEKVIKWAQTLGAVIALKGNIDIVSDGQEFYFNRTGSPLMTKGGFGDTLAGICGALLARGVAPFEAACASCYINGRAGELAVKEYGEGVVASDILEMIPKVIG